jgi:biopolymer transport protein ExbD/biopolymer transport protein TolR
MGGGGTGGAVSEINVTPLIDVLLVLLIIFMVIVPVTPKGLDAIVPQPPKNQNSEPDPTTIVVSVRGTKAGDVSYLINQDAYAKQDLEPKLAGIFAVRSTKVMFVKGDPDLFYGKVAEVIDMGHQAGVDNIGIITPQVEAGH